ncbi:MAG: diguanylate cyclase [Oscillospiraceae bacterium]|nr:diguanylate cyclase [Oscillospiraceae bacterium]
MEQLLFVSTNSKYIEAVKQALLTSYEITCAATYSRAYSLLRKKHYGVLLLGFDTADFEQSVANDMIDILCNDPSEDTPTVCIVPEGNEFLVSESLALGAADIIAYPFNPAIFALRIDRSAEVSLCRRNIRLRMDDAFRSAETISLNSLCRVAAAVDEKDIRSARHSLNTAAYAVAIGKALDWDEYRIRALHFAALLHDIGKLSTPDYILLKTQPLSGADFAAIRLHPVNGSELLSAIPSAAEILGYVRHHHENYDGTGYPDGLAGAQIPIESRIIIIAGAYDTMVSGRMYREPILPEKARAELLAKSGTQFDPRLASMFVSLLDSGFTLPENVDFPLAETLFSDECSLFFRCVINEQSSKWRHAAERDYLTGLRNRRSGETMISRCLAKEDGALMMIDIDNFKQVNDTYGHLSGDYALKQTAGVFTRCARGDDIVCRTGGDEYLIYLRRTSDPETVKMVAARILDEYAAQIERDSIMKGTSLSIGIALSDVNSHDFTDLLNRADKALYHVKQNGKSNYYLYDSQVRSSSGIKRGSRADMDQLIELIKNRNSEIGVFRIDFRQFNRIYEFASHFARRNDQELTVILLTLHSASMLDSDLEHIEFAMHNLEKAINASLRSVDISAQYSSSQYVVVLMGSDKYGAGIACSRISRHFYELFSEGSLSLDYMVASIGESKENVGQQKLL